MRVLYLCGFVHWLAPAAVIVWQRDMRDFGTLGAAVGELAGLLPIRLAHYLRFQKLIFRSVQELPIEVD